MSCKSFTESISPACKKRGNQVPANSCRVPQCTSAPSSALQSCGPRVSFAAGLQRDCAECKSGRPPQRSKKIWISRKTRYLNTSPMLSWLDAVRRVCNGMSKEKLRKHANTPLQILGIHCCVCMQMNRMEKSLESTQGAFATVRTGRANAGMLDRIVVRQFYIEHSSMPYILVKILY